MYDAFFDKILLDFSQKSVLKWIEIELDWTVKTW